MKTKNFITKIFLPQMVFTFEGRIFKLCSRIINLMLVTLLVMVINSIEISAQDRTFNLDVYKQFLIENEDITPAELYKLYPSGLFKDSVTPFVLKDVNFLNKIDSVYQFTPAEKSLLLKNGFVVTERQQTESFVGQFRDIFYKDLPVFVSTDAMLHAFHASYDAILKEAELKFLIPKLKELLSQCHSKIKDLDEKYKQNPNMKPMLRDVDVYFTVSLRLLDEPVSPWFNENSVVVNELLDLIQKEKPQSYKLFSESCPRVIDFSQFKPRGHYTDQYWPKLQNYFRTMIWLGRIEIYLSQPSSTINDCSDEMMNQTVQRQIIDAALIHEIASKDDITGIYNKMEEVVSFFVGEQDNVTLNDLAELFNETGVIRADSFLVDNNLQKFKNSLKAKPWSGQNILSQILSSDSSSPESLNPASAFMLFGQRFVIDSYVAGQVVYDKIMHQNNKICRLQPSTLDVLFSLGNDASTQLLIPELNQFNYSDNLAGLRYLIDQYPDEFWESSLYNMWLYIIKSLNPQPAEENIPEFMQTGAWGTEKMNSQLSSWTELRHDNLLYAKQSYSGGDVCFYPAGYVEPNPVFYKRMKKMADIAISKFSGLPEIANEENRIVDYFKKFYGVCDTLDMIVSKELNNQILTNDETRFIKELYVRTNVGCGRTFIVGWYPRLYYGEDNALKPDFLVADYHTTPTDCIGNPVGWISHAGTGMVDMMISIVNSPVNQRCAYVGPVMSYHEYVTTNFQRLTDEEWSETYLSASMRPEWVWNYLADANGNSKNANLKLYSNMDELKKALKTNDTNTIDNQVLNLESVMSVYPNPMTNSTIIYLDISESQKNVNTRLTLYDIQGKMIKILLYQNLSPGHYLTKWDRSDQSGNLAPSGMYILKLDQGNHSYTTKVVVTD